MEWISIIKESIEYLYYIAGIVLAFGIFITLKQLKLMKKDIEVKNKRASVEKSIEFLKWYAKEFIPAHNEYLRNLHGKSVLIYTELNEMSFCFNNEVSVRDPKVIESITLKVQADDLGLMNNLEFFSAAMISGLADEELAFTPLAKTYCDFVEFNYDVYCYSRRSSSTKFTNTIELYRLWKEKLEAVHINEEIEALEKRKSKVQAKSVAILGNES